MIKEFSKILTDPSFSGSFSDRSFSDTIYRDGSWQIKKIDFEFVLGFVVEFCADNMITARVDCRDEKSGKLSTQFFCHGDPEEIDERIQTLRCDLPKIADKLSYIEWYLSSIGLSEEDEASALSHVRSLSQIIAKEEVPSPPEADSLRQWDPNRDENSDDDSDEESDKIHRPKYPFWTSSVRELRPPEETRKSAADGPKNAVEYRIRKSGLNPDFYPEIIREDYDPARGLYLVGDLIVTQRSDGLIYVVAAYRDKREQPLSNADRTRALKLDFKIEQGFLLDMDKCTSSPSGSASPAADGHEGVAECLLSGPNPLRDRVVDFYDDNSVRNIVVERYDPDRGLYLFGDLIVTQRDDDLIYVVAAYRDKREQPLSEADRAQVLKLGFGIESKFLEDANAVSSSGCNAKSSVYKSGANAASPAAKGPKSWHSQYIRD